MDSKPKRFSEVHPNESTHLVDALIKTTNHELLCCGKCHEPIPTQSRNETTYFCTKCGTGIDWSDTFSKNYKSCPNCHLSNNIVDQFCRVCGTALDENQEKKGF